MALTTRVSGTSRTRLVMAMESKCGLTVPFMRASGRTISKKVKEDSFTRTEICMKVTGEGTRLMARDSTSTSMEPLTTVSGETTSNKAMGWRLNVMELHTKVTIVMVPSTVLAHSSGLTAARTRVKSVTT